MELVEMGHLPSQMGALLPPQCRCSGSVLTAIAKGVAGDWLCCPRSPIECPPASHKSSPHFIPHAGSLIRGCLFSGPRFFEQPLAQGTAHGICVLPQAPPKPPTGDKGTERVGGVGVLPSFLPSACLCVLSTLK